MPGPKFNWGAQTYVMGILNLTPDSFSGDGLVGAAGGAGIDRTAAAVRQAQSFVQAGADILDVGGESTRPGAVPVSEAEEIERVIPTVSQLLAEFPDIPVSIDTYKSRVARSALEAGASIVNDVWALRADPQMAEVVRDANAFVILMHNRSNPDSAELNARLGGRYVGVKYENLLEDVKRELLESVALARRAGIAEDRIILDPGIGFGKTVSQNLELIDRLAEIRTLGYPVLIGPSRKSFIGYTLDRPLDQRLEGTAAAVAIGIARGADIVRVHDVSEMVLVRSMADAIVRRSGSALD